MTRGSARAGSRSRWGCARGVVMIEHLIAFTPLLLLSLGILQLALLSAASLVVEHAAVAGVRAACVVLDDDPRYYGTPRGDLSQRHAKSDVASERALVQRLGFEHAQQSVMQPAAALDGPRMAAIRRAVHVPLSAITPEPWLAAKLTARFGTVSVADTLGNSPATRLLFGLRSYLPVTTAITFPLAPGSSQLAEGRLSGEDSVTLRVTHVVPCTVPLVSALMCHRLRWDSRHRVLAPSGEDRELSRKLDELRLAPDAAGQRLLALSALSVAVLQAEATLPAQSAPYRYASERKAGARP